VSRHVRRGLSILSIGWLLFLLEPLSSTGLVFPFFLATFAITVVLGVVSLALVLTRRPANPLRMLAGLAYPVAAATLVLLFLFSQSPSNPLFRLRFHLSQPALEAATRIALSDKTVATPTWLGLFPVHRVDVYPAEVRFMSDGCGVIDECGLAYIPGPVPRGRSKTRVKHLAGPWYHLYAVF
jgi:hypothetical protein